MEVRTGIRGVYNYFLSMTSKGKSEDENKGREETSSRGKEKKRRREARWYNNDEDGCRDREGTRPQKNERGERVRSSSQIQGYMRMKAEDHGTKHGINDREPGRSICECPRRRQAASAAS